LGYKEEKGGEYSSFLQKRKKKKREEIQQIEVVWVRFRLGGEGNNIKTRINEE
jgi:hypothetical protein